MYRKQIFNMFLIITCISAMQGCCFAKAETFVLWQLPSQTGGQMNFDV